MSSVEVKEVIARAEMMREADQKEAKRVVVRTALETLCQEILFSFSSNSADSKSQKLMDKAQDCLDWLKQNQEASEDTYQGKLTHLERESGKSCRMLNNSYGASMDLETCFSLGKRCLSQSEFLGACQWFYKAYKEAGSQEKEKKYQAVLRIGQVCREFANKETEKGKMKEKFIYQGTSLLVFELKAWAMTTSSFELAAELGKLKDVFFNKVSI